MEKNLGNKEALEKLKKLVEEINICMFITNTRGDQEHTRPMATIEVEENGLLWFYTDVRSIKVEEVTMQREVHLVYAHPGKSSYLDVWGSAEIVTDRQQVIDKWSPVVKAYFPDGANDPNLALLKVQPVEAYYWEAESGKMIHFLKMAASVVVGKRLAEGAEGSLNL
ncbi:MAG TPA: pyridoxamine 5'-phosphate oxidase family protein [Chitinophagaceae bacterium]|jgi:general stress protein 26|nr:pyridoxamine 5'-phosphate oxidase family protein [Chitinophagaceae bacterium]